MQCITYVLYSHIKHTWVIIMAVDLYLLFYSYLCLVSPLPKAMYLGLNLQHFTLQMESLVEEIRTRRQYRRRFPNSSNNSTSTSNINSHSLTLQQLPCPQAIPTTILEESCQVDTLHTGRRCFRPALLWCHQLQTAMGQPQVPSFRSLLRTARTVMEQVCFHIGSRWIIFTLQFQYMLNKAKLLGFTCVHAYKKFKIWNHYFDYCETNGHQ